MAEKSATQSPTRKELRSTGLVVGSAAAVLGLLQLLFHGRLPREAILGLFIAAAILILLAWLVPAWLRPFHFVWMKLAAGIGWVMNRVILGLLFFVFFTLFGLASRIARRDLLQLDFHRRRDSYWNARPATPSPKERYERQF